MKINLTELLQLKTKLTDVHANMKNTLGGISTEITSVNNNLVSSSLRKSNDDVLNKVSALASNLDISLSKLIEFLGSQIDLYQVTNEEAKAELDGLVNMISETFGENGVVLASVTGAAGVVGGAEAVADSTATGGLDLSVYTSKPELGFVVTSGNKTYDLSQADKEFMYAIVSAESCGTYDDALAVSSVILNRCENPWNVRTFGETPRSQMQAKYNGGYQFSVYGSGSYKKYLNGNASEQVKKAVDDALAGVRNCSYLFFQSRNSTRFSNNQVSPNGNRFK